MTLSFIKWLTRSGRATKSRSSVSRHRRRIVSRHVFDVGFYGRQVGIDFGQDTSRAVSHFLQTGDRQDADPHPLFSTSFYRRQAGLDRDTNALLHFLDHGRNAKADPHPLFNANWYRKKNKDVLGWLQNPLLHYITKGYRERRPVHPLFDEDWYRRTYPDIDQDDTNAFAHFVSWGAFEGRSPSELFDASWYASKYNVRGNALAHYVQEGAAKGFDPSPRFSSVWYVSKNPSVATANVNPLVHFMEVGRAAGQRPIPFFALDEKFSIDDASFDEWRQLLRSNIPEIARATGKDGSEGGPKERLFIILRSARSETARSAPDAFAESFRDDCDRLGLDARVVRDVRSELDSSDLSEDAFVLFLQDGDVLDRAGLEALHAAFRGSTRLCVFDMFFRKDGRAFPILLPGFNPSHLRAVDCTFSRFALRGDDVHHLLEAELDKDDRKLLLAALDHIAAERDFGALVHVPFPVVRIADISEDVGAMRDMALATPTPDIAALGDVKVSVVICTKDKGLLLQQLLTKILGQTERFIAEVIIVSNQTTNAYAERTFRHWSHHPKVRIIRYEKSFNFSEQSNLGVAGSTGDFVLFLNDDIVPVTTDWLQALIAPFAAADVGMTGPLLLYPNEKVQHAGMYVSEGVAHHTLRHASLPERDYLLLATSVREVSVVTGAALLMRRSVFDDLNGFDVQLASIYQDVDLCLRASKLGLRILYVPQAILLHMESVTLQPMIDADSSDKRSREIEHFQRQHGPKALTNDPFHNPCYYSNDETLRSLHA